MRLTRIVFSGGPSEAGEVALDLHPRLTVVGGMDPDQRRVLATELVGALSGDRPGVRLELEGVDGAGVPSELARLGLADPAVRARCRLGADDLASPERHDVRVESLAAIDQDLLWDLAEQVRSAEAGLTGVAPAAVDDLEAVDRVEQRHAAHEAAAERFELVRRATFYVSGFAGVLAVPTTVEVGAPGLALAAVAALGAIASIVAWRLLCRAERAEAAALQAAGASSYLGFNLERVNGLLGDDAGRRRSLAAVHDRREARSRWHDLAGDVSLEWALGHREEIEAAARLRREVGALEMLSRDLHAESEARREDLVHALVTRLAEARRQGGSGVPLVLDEPFVRVEPALKPLLLELIGRSAGDPQLVLLTGDEDTASWARLEALTGELDVVEPSSTRSGV